MPMEIIVNGETRCVCDALSVAQLLTEMSLPQQRLAVEVNMEIVPRSAYTTQQLQAGDRVEIIRAVGGG